MEKKSDIQKAFSFLLEYGFEPRRYVRPPAEECVYMCDGFGIEVSLYRGVSPSFDKKMCLDVIVTADGARKNVLDCADIFGEREVARLKSGLDGVAVAAQIPVYARFVADGMARLGLSRRYVDIYSKGVYPADALSNFAAHPFVLDGVPCASMEGFLQSLKFRNAKKQRRVCALVGKQAKRAGGKKRLWRITGNLYWQGVRYKRDSAAFDGLRKRAYVAMLGDDAFRTALLAAKGMPLRHTSGKSDKRKTVLTEREFIDFLVGLYDLL